MEESVRPGDGAAVGVVVASEGYPEAPAIGRRLEGGDPTAAGDDGDTLVFHAGTRAVARGSFETTGGRVVTIVGRGPTIADARAVAYRGLKEIGLDGGRYRNDVGELHLDDRTDLRDEAG
jgi:phosphoribosylamine--glycine ligase